MWFGVFYAPDVAADWSICRHRKQAALCNELRAGVVIFVSMKKTKTNKNIDTHSCLTAVIHQLSTDGLGRLIVLNDIIMSVWVNECVIPSVSEPASDRVS